MTKQQWKDVLSLIALTVVVILLVGGCARQQVPEVTAEDASMCPAVGPCHIRPDPPGFRGQQLLAIFALIPGVNFFALPVEQSLTGTTGLEQTWIGLCESTGGVWVPWAPGCTYDAD